MTRQTGNNLCMIAYWIVAGAFIFSGNFPAIFLGAAIVTTIEALRPDLIRAPSPISPAAATAVTAALGIALWQISSETTPFAVEIFFLVASASLYYTFLRRRIAKAEPIQH